MNLHLFLAAPALVTVAFLSGCTSNLGTVSRLPTVPTAIKTQLGPTLAVRTPAAAAPNGFDAGLGRLTTIGDGAACGAIKVLRAGASDPHGAIIALALTPVGAAVGAVVATVKHAPSDAMALCEDHLQDELAIAAQQHQLRDHFLNQVRARPELRIVLVPSDVPIAPTAIADSSWVVEISIDDLRLARVGLTAASYALKITARVRLISTTDGAIGYDAPVEFESGTSLFFDWADNQFHSLRLTADYGYRLIAEQIAQEFFST